MSLKTDRQKLYKYYKFNFPDDFSGFWEFARETNPDNPQEAFWPDPLNISLDGAFDVLAGKFDNVQLTETIYSHARFANDPPEFFTIVGGISDGLTWGYWMDDPAEGPQYVVSYYRNDAYEISIDGNTIFEAVRASLEGAEFSYEQNIEYYGDDPEELEHAERNLEKIDEIRQQLLKYATSEYTQTGEDFMDEVDFNRKQPATANTWGGMGIVVPENLYHPPSRDDKTLWKYLIENDEPTDVIAEGWQFLREGFPGTTLKLGKDLWILNQEKDEGKAGYELMLAAYEALDRNLLAEVLRAHQPYRFAKFARCLYDENDR